VKGASRPVTRAFVAAACRLHVIHEEAAGSS
jgi:hypothetical protein